MFNIYFLVVSGGEIPPKKLQALQKVLQSEFCNAIREVCNSKRTDLSEELS